MWHHNKANRKILPMKQSTVKVTTCIQKTNGHGENMVVVGKRSTASN